MEVKVPILMGSKKATVGKICVSAGDPVAAGQVLFSLETKKGTMTVKASTNGIVESVLVSEGDQVTTGQVLSELGTGAADSAASEPATSQKPQTQKVQTQPAKQPQEKTTELLILGGGPGGYVAAIAAAKHGKQVTLVEEDRLGGTCLNRGCIPTKSLITSADLCHRMTQSDQFGLALEGTVRPQMKHIIRRKDEIVEQLAGGVESLMEKNRIEVLRGTAQFKNNHTVRVTADGTEYLCEFKDCIIATGSVQKSLPLPGIDLPEVMDSTAALDSTELPRSVTVIGGGVIGMEFAFLYRKLGADVTAIVTRDRPLPMVDRDLGETLLEHARALGIQVELNSRVSGFERAVNGQIITAFRRDDKVEHAVSERVLLAVGRRPNTDGLGLEHTDVVLNPESKGIEVDEHMRTAAEHIYAIGDVNNLFQLAHAASHEGVVAVKNILGEKTVFDRTRVPSVIFTSPEIAAIGVSEDEAAEQGLSFKVGKFPFSANGRALTMNEAEGYVKLLKDDQDRIIGGAVIGPDASALIAAIGLAISGQMTDRDITDAIFAHPTTAEAIHEAALDLSLGAFHA
jgi:dihydrolipoamide dehydrogenase